MIPAVEPFTLAVLSMVCNEPGISRAQLYATPAQRERVGALIEQGMIEVDDGCRLTAAGKDLYESMLRMALMADDARYLDVRAQLFRRYNRRLAYMKKKREGEI